MAVVVVAQGVSCSFIICCLKIAFSLPRYTTNAGRIRRGVPIFVTFSPDEKHNMLMLRLSRCRRKDPVNEVDPLSRMFGGSDQPELGTDFVELNIPLEDLVSRVPLYDDRRAMVARDPLASVDGFRVLCQLAYEHLFGVRVCARCPGCNNADNSEVEPCQDIFGSNATPEGASSAASTTSSHRPKRTNMQEACMPIHRCMCNAYTSTHPCERFSPTSQMVIMLW